MHKILIFRPKWVGALFKATKFIKGLKTLPKILQYYFCDIFFFSHYFLLKILVLG